MVLPTSAHAAFSKGCVYFGLEERRVEVGPDYRADASAMADASDERTVLVVTAGVALWNMGVAYLAGLLLHHGAQRGILRL